MAHTQDALACAMIRSHFGAEVAETVRILLAAPGISLSQIVSHGSSFCTQSGIEDGTPAARQARFTLFRDSLSVLVQHAIAHGVECAAHDDNRENGQKKGLHRAAAREPKHAGARSRKRLVYYIRTENIFFRVRFPLYLGFARTRYGDVGAAAVRAYFERGLLTTHQVFTAELDSLLAKLDISIADAEACLSDMAKSGLMQWSGKRNVGVSISEDGNDDDEDMPIAMSQKNGRKRARPPSPEDGDESVRNTHDNGLGEELKSISVGRGHHQLIVGAPTRANDQDIWRICFLHLNREFRNECCALVVRLRVSNELSLRILRAGLQIALDEEDCQSPSDDFETSEIDTKIIQMHLTDQDGTIRDHDFWEAIKILIEQTPAFVVGIPENAPSKLRFIPGQLISDARQKTLEDLIASRYGAIGRRLFRALAIDGGMEEKMLAEKCMLPLKVAREHLFRMYQDRMVGMQEVPRSHEPTRASNWYYLWKVNSMSVYRAMMGVMYKTILNLFVRLQALDSESVSSEAENAAKKVRKELIMGSIVRMDQSVMVMRDFGPINASYLPSKYILVDGLEGRVKKRAT